MAKASPTRYRTTNWSDYNAALRKRGPLSVWFDPDMVWHAAKSGKRGRPETFSDAAIQTCLTLKVLFGLPLRQTGGLVESLIRMARLDWPVPDYSTLCRRQARITVQIPYRASGQPLNLLVDSTGIKSRGDGEWLARKHGASRRRQWRKVHIAMDAGTGDVRAVEFSSSRHGDSPLLPELLAQIPPDEPIDTVTADGAYDTRRCHGAIIERGAEVFGHSFGPVAVMPSLPIRRNGRAWKEKLSRCHRAKRRPSGDTTSGPSTLEEMGRIPRPKSGRGAHELPEALWRADHVTRPRPPDRRNSDPHCHHEPHLSPWKG